MKTSLRFLLSFMLPLCSTYGAFAQQDCFDAIYVCSDSYLQNNSYSGVGSVQEVSGGNTCLGNGEINSVWYIFTVTTSGNLRFQLDPLNANDDYDFALFNLTNDSCSGILAGTNQPVSCNYSATTGATGLSSSASGNNNGTSDPNQNAPVSVLAGETYVLLVSNFTASQTGYQLDFSGNASISDNQSPEPISVDLKNVCNPKLVFVYFDEDIDCSSIASDGSDFTVSGPSAVSITGANGIGCAGGRTSQIRLNFSNKIQATGTYTISINTGADGNTLFDGCVNETSTGTSIDFLVEFIGPDVSIINISGTSCGQDQGTAEADVADGTSPYSYNWNSSPSQSTAVASNLEPGDYRITVTDANGCKDKATVSIDNSSSIDLSNTIIGAVSCGGASNGTAQVIPTGGVSPYDIEWQTNPIQTGQNANGLSGGPVEVLITDATGCEERITLNIPEANTINLSTTLINPDCGIDNGSATVTPTGGNGSFTFSWNTSPPQNTAVASGLSAGIYTVVVTDQNGCSRTTNVILTDNAAPNASITSSTPDCGQGVGEATALATSGPSPYSYEWNTTPPQNTSTATGLSEGDYFVTVTDATGCTQIINVKIDVVDPPQMSLILTQPDCGQSNGSATATITDGTSPFTFIWSSSTNTIETETGLSQGNYSVTVTDDIGCTDSQTFDLIQQPPTSDFFFTDACLGDEVSFSTQSTTMSTSWTWDFGDGTTSNQENPDHLFENAGVYSVTVFFDGGCMPDTATYTVEVFDLPTADFTVGPEIITTQTSALFSSTGSPANGFLWDFGDDDVSSESNPYHQFGEEGSHTISLTTTDRHGCTDDTTHTIEVLLQPVIYFPNAFLPNGNVENTRFKGYGIGITQAELTIFDRWGTMLYHAANMNAVLYTGWDGTYNGKLLPQGVYAYKVKAAFYNNSSFEKIGTVTLLQ